MSIPGSDLSHPASSTDPSRRSACIDRLDGVRDDVAAHEREVHALVAHRDAVGHRDRAELERVAAGGVHAVLRAPCASRSSDRLHGVISFHETATPICGLAKSSSPIPTARSMPRDAVASSPSVTWRDRGLMSVSAGTPGSAGGIADMPGTYPPDNF